MNIMATDTVAPAKYYLTPHTFICLVDGIYVFLDLNEDRYICLERRETVAFSCLMDLPIPKTGLDEKDRVEIDISETVKSLTNQKLITKNKKLGKKAKIIKEDNKLEEILGYDIYRKPKIYIRDLYNFFKSLVLTKIFLRFSKISYIVDRVRKRKKKNHSLQNKNPETILHKVEIYKILKPIFVTVRGHCLFNSLFLIEFLSSYHIYPLWVFAVKVNGFSAHCWVQGDHIMYDDSIAHACLHKPIMTV